MRWHCYRDPYLWVRGEGLCRLSHRIAQEDALADWAVAHRVAVLPSDKGEIMTMDTTSRLQRVSGPSGEPLSLSDAKAFLRIEHAEDDAVISRAINAAREAAEEQMQRVLLPQSYCYMTGARSCMVVLPVGPAQSVSLVQWMDAQGNATTIENTQYRLTIDGFGLLLNTLPPGVQLAVTYSASSAATAEEVPALVKQGMLHHIAAMLEQRQGTVPLPAQSLACYQPYRRRRL